MLWIAAVWVAGPRGNFPLSDDWAYAHLVRSLCEGRGFDPLPWTGASAVVQAVYGAATCAMGGGFSHEALRWTTLAMSAVGIASLHFLLLELGAAAHVAAAGAAVLAFSPLWFNLSFTFMTDVPFVSLAIASSWLYVRALRAPTPPAFFVAGAVAAAAFLIRQHALVIPVAAALAVVWPARRDEVLAKWKQAAMAVALPLAALAGYALWAATAAELPLAVRNKAGEALAASPLAMADVAFRALATLGLLVIPWMSACRLRGPGARRARTAALALLAAVAAFLFVRDGDTMFYLTNVLGDFTVGAITTRDVLFLDLQDGPDGPLFLKLALTAGALAGVATLVGHLASALTDGLPAKDASGRPASRRAALFCVLALLLSGVLTLVQARYYFDRYVLVLLPLAIASATALAARVEVRGGAVAAWVALALYGVTGTHDYMEWNRARWSLLEAAEARGITARQIDGGVEYNAARLAADLRTAPSDAQARRGQPASEKSWWWVEDDEWIVAFRRLEGYSETDSREFERWLPPGRERVVLLHRESAQSPEREPGAAAPAAAVKE